jgi:PAS domain S-box-containing protein
MPLGTSLTGVPFAFLAGVQLLSVAAALILAGTACSPRMRRRTTAIFVVGAALIAIADAVTATTYGHPGSDRLADLRAAGLLLIAIGLASGVLRPPGRDWPPAAAEAVGVGAVVVPLGASLRPTTATAIAAALAALAAVRVRRDDPVGAAFLSTAFVLYGFAGALGHAALTSRAAGLTLLAARGLAALLVLADVARLARTSVLAKVVAAMLTSVLLMAIAAVGVGSVVADEVGLQQASQARRVAQSQLQALLQLRLQAGSFAGLVTVCPKIAPNQCQGLLQRFGVLPGSFAALVPASGSIERFGDSGNLSAAAALQLRSQPIVQDVLSGRPGSQPGESTLAVLDGELTVLGVWPEENVPVGSKPGAVAVYGGRINNGYAADQQTSTTYAVTVLIGGQPTASSLTTQEANAVADVARHAGVSSGALAKQNIVVKTSRGVGPTVAFGQLAATDGTPLGVLAVSQNARLALAAERRASSELFVTALAVMILVSLVAVVLGRRIVDPVRRLTVVASRVRRGDLTAKAGRAGPDEVGTLSRAFDAMTTSVASLTDDLRAAAAQEAALRARLETVLASMSDGLVATDADGAITSINPAACELAGVQADEAAGRPLNEVLDVRDLDGDPVLHTDGHREQVDGYLRRADGSSLSVQLAVAPLEGTGGVVVVVRDQSRERDLERMKTEFLSNVSHELRTPLTPIRGYAELLRRQTDLSRKQAAGYVDTILDSATRMGRVVDLLVDVAAIEAGRVHPDLRPVSVDRYLSERLEVWRQRYPARADDLRRRVARGLPKVAADPVWVGKALDELVDNAMKYTPAGTSITVGASSAEQGRVQLSVRDNGPGIEPSAMPELFSDFVQVDGSVTRTVGGLGLGLAFVRRLTEAFGLGLSVRSQPGSGAEFTLDLPAATATDVGRRPQGHGVRPSVRRRTTRPASVRRRQKGRKPPDG